MNRTINHLNDSLFDSEDREFVSSELVPNQEFKKMLRCADVTEKNQKTVWRQRGTRCTAGQQFGVCRSVGRPHSSARRALENKKARLLSYSPLDRSLVPQLSLRMALNFKGEPHWPKNRVAVFPRGSGGSSTSTNHRAKRLFLQATC